MRTLSKWILILAMVSNFTWAAAPIWKRNTLVLSAYAGNYLTFELNRFVVGGASLDFRLTGHPPMLSLGSTFTGGIFTLEGQPEITDLGTYHFTIEATEDRTTWVPTKVQLTIVPRPAMTCTDGSEAKFLGQTPKDEYKIFSCKVQKPTPTP